MNKKVLGTVLGGVLVFSGGAVSSFVSQPLVLAAENPVDVSTESIVINTSIENYLYVLVDQNREKNIHAIKGNGSRIVFDQLQANKHYRIDMYEIDPSVQFSLTSDGVSVVSGQTITDASKVLVIDNQGKTVGMVPYVQGNMIEKSAGWPTDPAEAFYLPNGAISGEVKTKTKAIATLMNDSIQITNTNRDKAYLLLNGNDEIKAIVAGNGGIVSIPLMNRNEPVLKVIEAENMDDQSPTERHQAIAMDGGVKANRIYIINDGHQIISYKKGFTLGNNAMTIPLNGKHLADIRLFIVTDVDTTNLLAEWSIPLEDEQETDNEQTDKPAKPTDNGGTQVIKPETGGETAVIPDTTQPSNPVDNGESDNSETDGGNNNTTPETNEKPTTPEKPTIPEKPTTPQKLGWQYDQKQKAWQYFDQAGQAVKNQWVGAYYLKADSYMAHQEWIFDKNDESWFYLHEDGHYAQNEWVGSYYLKAYGYMAHKEWIFDKNDDSWFYLHEDGHYAQNEWIGSYYLKAYGYMANSEWIFDKNDDSWFYLHEDGHYAQNEWVGSYYLKAYGYMAHKEWIFDKDYDAWYYLKDNGQYAHNETINGYKLDPSGKWVS